MKTYLVGGAVRDTLLGRKVTEKDYVVVGSSPEAMLDKGFKPVGKQFPVFLHPDTQEEYALARSEKKSGKGYGGFTFYTSKDITLEQDLMRRDLTINAMAQDTDGSIIDPYGGQQDLAQRVLRHVSDAFIEDPLRVLRIARFMARYADLGFTIAPETLALMKQINASGELQELTAERVWQETERALMENNADVYFYTLKDCGALSTLFPEIDALFGIPQRAEYHPEIDSGIHTMMALRIACQQQLSSAIRFAVLVHDLGKALTPKEVLPKHIMHEVRGIEPVKQLCARLKVPSYYQQLALLVCKEHLMLHQLKQIKTPTLWALLKRLDALRRPEQVHDFALACMCDAKGRLGFENIDYPQIAFLDACVSEIRKINMSHLDNNAQIESHKIGEALDLLRLNALKEIHQHYKNSN